MRDHSVDDPVLAPFVRRHEVVALHVLRDPFERLPGVLGDDLFQAPLDGNHFARLDLDVGCLSFEAAGDLVEQDLRVWQRHSLPLRAAGEEQGAHRHREPDTGRLDVRPDELHRVVDREPGVDRAAGISVSRRINSRPRHNSALRDTTQRLGRRGEASGPGSSTSRGPACSGVRLAALAQPLPRVARDPDLGPLTPARDLPRLERIPLQPAGDRRGRGLADAALDDPSARALL
jgi:hypothetical protein